ncbi:MAG: winged helix DNA-binding domain-containing protein [Nocardioidaceae bacterium]|nr:winged helix DNA-binding domain-containing protein [Nocardioidaceae bacterium]
MAPVVTRAQVIGSRIRAQQLDREHGSLAQTAVLDIGAQDTGPDGAMWALAIRGVDVGSLSGDELAKVWTIRGAPHVYRRADLAAAAAATAPYSDADAGKRIFDAAKPLKAAGITNLAALDAVAATMREVVTEPTVKGEVSSQVAARMDPPYLRYCRPCGATHLHEMPFRLAALRAGLELELGTSPPVLRPIQAFRSATTPPEAHDLVRAYLRLLGPATPKLVAAYLDAPVHDVSDRWPDEVVEVRVDGEQRSLLAGAELTDLDQPRGTRLLGPFDLFLQARDRPLLVPDPGRAKQLWPRLGRPGAVLVDGEIVGTWRPRAAGKKLTVVVTPWARLTAAARRAVGEQAERLAAFRRATLASVELDS